MKMSDDTTFWNGVRAAILLDGISGAQVHSVTGSGVVDGNGVPHWISEYPSFLSLKLRLTRPSRICSRQLL